MKSKISTKRLENGNQINALVNFAEPISLVWVILTNTFYNLFL